MKYINKIIYFSILLISILLINTKIFAKSNTDKYNKENISNYFLGVISSNQGYNNTAFKYFKRAKSLKNRHSQFNNEFLRTLVLLEKFDDAFTFSKSVWKKDEYFFEADLLLGLNALISKDYKNAEKHFMRLKNLTEYNFIFEDFIGSVLMAWTRAAEGNKKDSYRFIEDTPSQYNDLTKIQNVFLKCYFDNADVKKFYEELIMEKNYDFSRYNFFLANYLLFNNDILKAKEIIKESRRKDGSNLIIKQSESFILNNKEKKIKFFFNCKNPKDSIAEFFYIIANLYASEKYYSHSNFYLKISLFLNKKFSPNKALLAENYYYQKKYKLSENIYRSIKSIGPEYSWHASKSIAKILLKTKGKRYSVNSLEKDFNLISNPNFEHYYALANFYKDNEYYEKSVEYYSLVLNNLEKDHKLIPKVLDRRGTSYERMGKWKLAEKDLKESLNILPDQAYVLNYLAYTWVDKKVNLEEALTMLKKAMNLKKNDPYITDSIGWAYFVKKKYDEAEYYLQQAVELLPNDPVINDHYADTLWMLDKNIQARHIWNQVLELSETEQKLKDVINHKLVFGVKKKL